MNKAPTARGRSLPPEDIYLRELSTLRLGKVLPDSCYVHVSALHDLPTTLQATVEGAREIAGVAAHAFHVVKFSRQDHRVSLLVYPRFFEDGFPSLLESWSVDLTAGKATHLRASDLNPPILHRKETLLSPKHPAVAKLRRLTEMAEGLGLFEKVSELGTLQAWTARLQRLRLAMRGNDLVSIDEATPATNHTSTVHRHRTALTRYALSAPMQLLWKFGYLDGQRTVFDYGCGRGDDVRALSQNGLKAGGWDPHFAPDQAKAPAQVVNLGYVLNVIEDPRERREALQGAWDLTETVLAISVLIGGRTEYEKQRLFRDGVLTARGTFQKYFTQGELRAYLESELGRDPVAVAPGIFFVFRTDEDEQRFLLARQSFRPPSNGLPAVPRERPPGGGAIRITAAERKLRLLDQHADLIAEFWSAAVRLGRQPEEFETPRASEVREHFRSPATLFRLLTSVRGTGELEARRAAIRDDLLVFLALALFERRRSAAATPDEQRRAIRALWGSQAAAQAEAQRLLFSTGDPTKIRAACLEAVARGDGVLEEDRALFVHAPNLPRLAPILRVYVGCAARLYGEVDNADLIKIHSDTGKLTLLLYDDFEGKRLPMLLERVKVDLRRQDISFFEYGSAKPQALFLKGRYLAPDHPERAEQEAFDRRVQDLGLDFSGLGPEWGTFRPLAEERGLIDHI